ncbi:hypothetical protein NY547_09240 [Cnuibacter physcomitrellae]|uniref:hypothetical protein n=1 Tax=Cnuibacter physcomitrellae TaxID=1619308 RepID=UPI0021760E24|nr:hypothetical protein [Cnuibacter physcomitrellae]MCS5497419.1 hypothetical protein [Cnuibacter physcomitrellae]
MEVAVQLWSGEPLADSDDWEQVSVERLRVDTSSTVRLTSPTLPSTTCAVPQGEYWVEVSGRGFTNYGWPGSTEPGDRWRLRFWPGEAQGSRPSKLWSMPGYGTPWDEHTGSGH